MLDWPMIFDSFYEAALEPGLWVGNLTRAAEKLGVAGVSVIGPPNANVPTVNPNLLDEMASDYFSEAWYRQNDRLLNCIRFWGSGQGYGQTRLVSNETLLVDDPWMKRLPIQEEFFRRHKMRWFIGGQIRLSETENVYLSIDRFEHQERFSWDELKLADLLCQHLTRALKIVKALDVASATGALQSFDLIRKPVFLLGPDMKVLALTPVAETYLTTVFWLRGGYLAARDPVANDDLRRQVAGVLYGAHVAAKTLTPSISIRRKGGRPLVATVVPYLSTAPALFRMPRALLLLHDAEEGQRAPSPALISELLGITPGEARLAIALAHGATPRSAAQAFGVSLNTVRSQLASTFLKTGTSRQAELVHLIRKLTPPV